MSKLLRLWAALLAVWSTERVEVYQGTSRLSPGRNWSALPTQHHSPGLELEHPLVAQLMHRLALQVRSKLVGLRQVRYGAVVHLESYELITRTSFMVLSLLTNETLLMA